MLTSLIEEVWLRHETNYGSPRIYKELKKMGLRIGKKRVERLMQAAGLVGKAGRIYRRKARAKAVYQRLENLRVDAPAPTAPDQQWVGDLTYIRVAGRWHYLAVVMDVFSRRVIGWSLGKHKTAALVLRSLQQAFQHRAVNEGLIFHTDRGAEFGAELVQHALKGLGIRASMNRPGKVTDNAHIESFFQSMKTECIHGIVFETERELRMTLSHYIDLYYNELRMHSAIGYRSPNECEQQLAA